MEFIPMSIGTRLTFAGAASGHRKREVKILWPSCENLVVFGK
jgi:hypothetical protein